MPTRRSTSASPSNLADSIAVDVSRPVLRRRHPGPHANPSQSSVARWYPPCESGDAGLPFGVRRSALSPGIPERPKGLDHGPPEPLAALEPDHPALPAEQDRPGVLENLARGGFAPVDPLARPGRGPWHSPGRGLSRGACHALPAARYRIRPEATAGRRRSACAGISAVPPVCRGGYGFGGGSGARGSHSLGKSFQTHHPRRFLCRSGIHRGASGHHASPAGRPELGACALQLPRVTRIPTTADPGLPIRRKLLR